MRHHSAGLGWDSEADHLVFAVPDLTAGCDDIERRFGVRPDPGGAHPQWGTRNALLSLGPSVYLEIIGPDEAGPAPSTPRPFGIDTLQEPILVTWAVRRPHLAELAQHATTIGVSLGSIVEGRRRLPDGALLEWQLTLPDPITGGGLIPFFIDWGTSPHPAKTAPRGCTLSELCGEHPNPDRLRDVLAGLGVELSIQAGPLPQLTAVIDTPLGPQRLG